MTLAGSLAVGCTPEADAEDFGGGGGPEFEGAIERVSAAQVKTSPIVRREMVRAISTTTPAESAREIEVFPRTTGIVTSIAVEEGDRVAKGDVLMQIDPRELESALDDARVTLKEATDALSGLRLAVTEAEQNQNRAALTLEQSERELKRKEDVGAGVVSRNELDQLRLTVETNKADLEGLKIATKRAETNEASQEIAIERANVQVSRAELDLSYATLTASFDGVIARRTVRVGDLASNANAAFTLTDPDDVRAVVSRPQSELAFFRGVDRAHTASNGSAPAEPEDLEITIQPEALPGYSYTGHILFISPTIESTSGQFRVTIGIDQPSDESGKPRVLPGMLLRVRIVTDRHPDALVVPKRALVRESDSFYVFIAEEGRARRVQVREGFSDDLDVEVVASKDGELAPGMAVIVVGNRDLADGDAIEASEWEATPMPTDAPEEAAEDEGADGANNGE